MHSSLSKAISVTWILLLTLAVLPNRFNLCKAKTHDNDINNTDLDHGAILKKINDERSVINGYSQEEIYQYSKYVAIDNDSIQLVIGLNEMGYDPKNYLETVIERFYGEIVDDIRMNCFRAIVTDIPLRYVPLFTREIENLDFVKYIEPNAKYQVHFVPNDPYWNLQWGPQKINADYAWNITIGTHDIRVAIIDTGIDYSHSDLTENYVPLGYDWVNDDPDPMDDNGHGTHCAGIVAATLNNSVGIAGIAQVQIFAEKALDTYGSGSADDLAQAIIHAVQQNASVISMSWGGNSNSSLLYEAIKFAYDSGVLLFASAGNSRSDIKSYPAAYDEVIAISATDQYDKPAFFTNFGEWIELAAPGVQIISTVLNNEYDYKSGTSMSCPHAAGVAALVWSLFPNMTRDQIRIHLRYTSDDLGNAGFDEYYGYGRINAMKAVTSSLPEHDLLLEHLDYPYYVELNNTGTFKVDILNYGTSEERNIIVELMYNDTLGCSKVIDSLESGDTVSVTLTWAPTAVGLYNITIRILPFPSEARTENNYIKVNVYGGTPIKACVIRSSGTYWTWITTTWEKLNKYWFKYGNNCIFIDAVSLNKENISYNDLATCRADVLIISSAYSQDLGWEFSNSEIEAIANYVYEGHGLIITADTFYSDVPNNNKLARLLGIDETISWSIGTTSRLNILQTEHPIFRNIPNPYNLSFSKLTVIPPRNWTDEVLVGGEYVALGPFNESAIVTYRGVIYSSFAVESYSSDLDLQIIYNFITWSHYEKPQTDLIVGLETPLFALPNSNIHLNVTASNIGVTNESSVELSIYIDDEIVKHEIIIEIASNQTYLTSYLWTEAQIGVHNITAYIKPRTAEDNTLNNKITKFVTVSNPIIRPKEGQWANYTLCTFTKETSITELINFTYNYYTSPYQINVTYWHYRTGYTWVTSSIVNTINRVVEKGTWASFWFPGWIETNVTLGSQVHVLNSVGRVIGTSFIPINNRSIECWKLFVEFKYENYTFYYEKISGLLIGYDRVTISFQENLTLLETNIPVGVLIKSKVGDYACYRVEYFNNNTIEISGTMNFSYISFINDQNIMIRLNSLFSDKYGQIIENSTYYLVVNIQTRLVVDGPEGWNNTYYIGWIETFIDLGLHVRIWDQIGVVIGCSKYTFGQRTFDTWLVYFTKETSICFYNYDKISGLLVSSVESALSNQWQNVTTTLLSTNVDVTPPQIAIEKPLNNTFISTSDIEVQWRGLDHESGIAYYRICLNSTEIAKVVSDCSSYILTGLSEGMYTIEVEAYDFAGNMNCCCVIVVVDKTLPTAQITAPFDGSYVKDVVDINLSGDDRWFDHMTLLINTVEKATFLSGGNYSYSWNTREYNDGIYEISLIVVDKAGNIKVNNINVTVDNTLPQVQILQQAKYMQGKVNISTYVYDLNLKNVSLICNDTLVDYWADDGIHISTWDTNGGSFSDGNYVLKAKAFDEAGNYAESFLQVIVDNTPPTGEIISPANNTCISRIVNITFSFEDVNLQSAFLILDGEVLAEVTLHEYYEWDTTKESDSKHVLVLKVTDYAGNFEISTRILTVDNTKPFTEILFPKNNTIVAGEINLTFVVRDMNIKNSTLKINDRIWNVTDNTSLLVDTRLLPDGCYKVVLEAFDLTENHEFVEINITVDNTSPLVTINSPADNDELLGSVYINFTVSDNNLEKILIYIDNAVFEVTGETSFNWNTANIGDGLHIIKIVGVDVVGNIGENQIKVWTKNVQRAVEESYNSGRILGILLGSISVLVFTFIFIFFKRTPHLTKFRKNSLSKRNGAQSIYYNNQLH